MTALTTSEVVALFGIDVRRIRKDLEYAVFGSAGALRFEIAEVVYLFLVASLGFDLGVEDRKRIYSLVASAVSAALRPRRLMFGDFVEVNLESAVDEVERRLARFDAWKRTLLVRDDEVGGEPLFHNGRWPVRDVGERLRRGASVDEIRGDHPGLTAEDVELARIFAEAYPRMGRPRARRGTP